MIFNFFSSIFREADMMILVILSHGRDSAIFASDGGHIPTEEIYKKFNNENCPALMGKPKFFIIQACRGDETDAGMFLIVQRVKDQKCQK